MQNSLTFSITTKRKSPVKSPISWHRLTRAPVRNLHHLHKEKQRHVKFLLTFPALTRRASLPPRPLAEHPTPLTNAAHCSFYTARAIIPYQKRPKRHQRCCLTSTSSRSKTVMYHTTCLVHVVGLNSPLHLVTQGPCVAVTDASTERCALPAAF